VNPEAEDPQGRVLKNKERPFVDRFEDNNMNDHRHILNDPKVEMDQIQWETHLRKYVKDK